MKKISVACLVVILAGTIAGNAAWARGGGGHGGGGHFGGGHNGGHFGGYHGGGGFGSGFYGFGLGYGVGSYYGGFTPYGRYGGFYGYPPTVITVPTTPPVYIQQPSPVTQQYQSGYWYYCSNPEGYYPYIKECLNTWQQVAPRPSGR